MSSVRKPLGAVLVAAALALGFAGPVQADHDNARELCSQQYEGTYTHYTRVPIYTGDVVGGWVSLNYRIVDGGDNIKWCAVTLRRWHDEAKYTMVKIRRTGDDTWREDSGQFTRYAGPVMREMSLVQANQCMYFKAQIGIWTESFSWCNGVQEV